MKKLWWLLFATVLWTAAGADVQLGWDPPATLAQDKTLGYLLDHAGDDGHYTNFAFIALPATNFWATNLLMGTHSFRISSTNSVGLVGDPSAAASTNLVWKPVSPAGVTIRQVTSKSVTFTFQLQ